jgi:membrane protein
MKKISKKFGNFIKNLSIVFYKSSLNFIENNGIEQAGYIAYLIMLSLFPFVIFLTFILGLIGQTTIGLHFTNLILNSMPQDMGNTMVPIMNEITKNPSPSILSLAFLSIIWTASSFVEGLRTILNQIYKVKNKPTYILRRILSIIEFGFITLTMITAVFGFIIIPQLLQKLNALLAGNGYHGTILWTNVRGFITYMILFFMISLIYYMIPNKKQKIEFIFPGALVTLIGWIISGKLFTIYLKNFNQFNLIYGSLGGVIISLIFFYIISAILIYGAEFNYYFGEKFLKNSFIKKLDVF